MIAMLVSVIVPNKATRVRTGPSHRKLAGVLVSEKVLVWDHGQFLGTFASSEVEYEELESVEVSNSLEVMLEAFLSLKRLISQLAPTQVAKLQQDLDAPMTEATLSRDP
jgi:hypothetical protein